MRMRAEKNRRKLFGLNAPARVLTELVPRGCVAVDAGANAGLYSYWIAQAASQVHAFEPQPKVFERLRDSVPSNVAVHHVALSDTDGTAVLHIPATSGGEATLHGDLAAAHRDITETRVVTRTLDSFRFQGVGFLKIDVEGHEEALLRGSRTLVREQRPVVFIEIEERHNPGGLERICEFFRDLGYRNADFLLAGVRTPLERFDATVHQSTNSTAREYVNNFVFSV